MCCPLPAKVMGSIVFSPMIYGVNDISRTFVGRNCSIQSITSIMKQTFRRNGKKITYNYTVKTEFFDTCVEKILIKRTDGNNTDDIEIYPSFFSKVKIKMTNDSLSTAYKAFNIAPKEILRNYPIANDLIYRRNQYELFYDGLTLATKLKYDDYTLKNEFTGFDDALCMQVELVADVAHAFLDEYERLKKSRFMKVIRQILAEERRKSKEAAQRFATARVLMYAARLISICTTGNDTGGDIVAVGTASIGDIDFSQWLDSMEVDGQPDMSFDDKIDYLTQEGDNSDISFTGHTAGKCNICSCMCFQPVKSGDNSTRALCK